MLAIQDTAEAPGQESSTFEHQLARLAFTIRRTEGIPQDQIPSALSHLAALQASVAGAQVILISRMIASRSNGDGDKETIAERWLTADQAAELLKVDRKWLYRRANALPFTRRLSRKKLLFSEIGLRRWMATRKP